MAKFIWQVKSLEIPEDFSQLSQLLLSNREIKQAKTFFAPPHPLTLDPTALDLDPKQVKIMCARLARAHQEKSKIVIFGDYDADGICATAILWRLLFDAGFQVVPFIPNRLEHGYGLSIGAAQAVIDREKPAIILTVDNGVVAHEAVTWLNTQQIEVIITDHHQPERGKTGQPVLPQALALLLSTQLCGASLAWVVGRLILESRQKKLTTKLKTTLNQELDLCALATIADQVPLIAANRSFAYFGLKALQQTQRPGLLALFNQAGIKVDSITASSIGYSLAPRINALGRLAEGIAGVRLLCTNNQARANDLASNLNDLNIRRQDITQTALDEAERQVGKQTEESLLVVYSPDFHEGVIGLVAGRLCEKYFKPVVVMGGAGEVVKGSARSINGVNITNLIRQLKEELLDIGGHPLAAGFSLEKSKLELFSQKLQQLAKDAISSELLVPRVEADCQLPDHLVNLAVAKDLLAFGPFGQANPEPIFVLKAYEILACQAIGKESQHLKLLLKAPTDQGAKKPLPLTALFWRNGHNTNDFKPGGRLDLLVKLTVNRWREKESLQLIVLQTKVLS